MKHIDFTAYEVHFAEEDGGFVMPVIRATGNEGCEFCGEVAAEIVIDASELGPGGYDVGYCYEHAKHMFALAEQGLVDEDWVLKAS